ncbi:MAG: hypothetical protein AAF497_02320 [Planctomycetota bacterium]
MIQALTDATPKANVVKSHGTIRVAADPAARIRVSSLQAHIRQCRWWQSSETLLRYPKRRPVVEVHWTPSSSTGKVESPVGKSKSKPTASKASDTTLSVDKKAKTKAYLDQAAESYRQATNAKQRKQIESAVADQYHTMKSLLEIPTIGATNRGKVIADSATLQLKLGEQHEHLRILLRNYIQGVNETLETLAGSKFHTEDAVVFVDWIRSLSSTAGMELRLADPELSQFLEKPISLVASAGPNPLFAVFYVRDMPGSGNRAQRTFSYLPPLRIV